MTEAEGVCVCVCTCRVDSHVAAVAAAAGDVSVSVCETSRRMTRSRRSRSVCRQSTLSASISTPNKQPNNHISHSYKPIKPIHPDFW